MKSAFDIRTGEWAVEWPGRVARHDVVYLSPPMDPMQGLPLGNGDLGALCWLEDSRIIIQLNKCDLWDDAPFGSFAIGGHDVEEGCTSLKHAGRLIIDMGQPVFDTFYLEDFEGRINLADASISLRAKGPLGSVAVTAFIPREPGVLWLNIETELKENLPVNVRLTHWGSRVYSRWYSHVNRDPSLGLAGTVATNDDSGIRVVQDLRDGKRFAVACHAVAGPDLACRYETLQQREAGISLAGGAVKRFSLVTAVTAPMTNDPSVTAIATLDTACRSGRDALWTTHAAEWKSFWQQSFMECGDDYLDNLWHLTMYYLNSSQRGAYPGRFINGLWGWNRDVQPWNVYFHWNQQTLYWPLNAAGHDNLVNSYLEWRFSALPHAKADAKEVFNAQGAFVSDLVERRGFNSSSERGNHTPVAEIALDFWRQYQFTGEARFLRERALPYMIEAVLYLESRFERQADGLFHVREGTALEGWVRFRDATSELVYGRALCHAVLEALAVAGVDHPRAAAWKDLAEHLAPLPVTEADPAAITKEGERWLLKLGWFKGEPTPTNLMLAAGYRVDQQRMVPSLVPSKRIPVPMPDVHELVPLFEKTYLPQYTEMEYADVFPEVEYLAIFPSGLLGLGTPDSPLLPAARNTLRLYAPGLGGYDRTAVAMARLGMGREAWRVLEAFPGRWQFYCNGFGHYNWGMKADQAARFHINTPTDAAGAKFPLESWPFRHMGMESMSVLACALNECLLQSHDGVIRVAPAVTENQAARFTLHAVGGFVVSAEVADGKLCWIGIRSRRGGTCTVDIPWSAGHLLRNGQVGESLGTGEQTFLTAPGEFVVLTPTPQTAVDWACVAATPSCNSNPKTEHQGRATLGLPRMF